MIRLSANKKIIYRYSCYAHAKCLKTGYTTDYSNKFCCILHSSFLNSIIFTSNFFCKVFSNFLKYMKFKPGKLYYILHNDLSCCYITTFRLSTYTKIGIFDYFFCLEHQHGLMSIVSLGIVWKPRIGVYEWSFYTKPFFDRYQYSYFCVCRKIREITMRKCFP